MAIRPLLFWGVDPQTAILVKGFVENLKRGVAETAAYRIFDPIGENPLQEFKESIFKLREDLSKTHTLNAEPGVVLLSSAFAFQGRDNLELLNGIGEILERALPGDQSFTIIVFFPPQTAQTREKLISFKYFLRFEEIVWNIPHLKNVFVNQFYPDFHHNKGLNGEIPEKIHLNTPIELLYRELIDKDLRNLIQGIGESAIENQNVVLDRKCCYSTTGIYQLIYLRNECLKYLKTRIQNDMFDRALYNLGSIQKKKKNLIKIQDHADQFIQRQVKNFLPLIPNPETVSLAAPDQWFDLETLDKRLSKFEKDLSSETLRVKAACHKKLTSMKEIVTNEFIDFLDKKGKYYAEPWMYADSLMGTRLFLDAEKPVEKPSGIELFKMLICVDPYIESWALFFQPHLESVFVKLGLTLAKRFDTDSTFSWLLRSVKLAESRIKKIPLENEFELYFLFQFIDITLKHLRKNVFDLDSAKNLTHEMISKTGQGFHELESIMQRNRSRRAEAEEEGKRIRKTYGFFQRIFYKSSRDEFNRLESQRKGLIKSLDTEYHLFVEARQNVWGLLINSINHVVLPNSIRSIFCQTFAEETRDVCQKYYDFVEKIKTSVKNEWYSGSQITQFKEMTAATVLNKDRLDCLYEKMLKGRKIQELVEELFRFFPSDLAESELEDLTYYGCKNPKDHYLSGFTSLIGRMKDYSVKLSKPIKEMNIMDVISIEGKEKANQYLKENVEKTKKFLDFSEGLLPLVEQQKKMRSAFVIRSDDLVNRKLISDHDFIFGADAHFVDNNDPDKIDITRLVFGFPAFLIHGLSECRDIFRDSEEIESGDLWPSSAL